MRILIIEDDPVTVTLLTMMLEELGLEVCGSEATEEGAVAAAAAYAPQMMIVDVNLRVGTGIAAVKQILSSGHIPHVFVSADLTQLRAENPDAVMLQKPYVVAEMTDAIHRAGEWRPTPAFH